MNIVQPLQIWNVAETDTLQKVVDQSLVWIVQERPDDRDHGYRGDHRTKVNSAKDVDTPNFLIRQNCQGQSEYRLNRDNDDPKEEVVQQGAVERIVLEQARKVSESDELCRNRPGDEGLIGKRKVDRHEERDNQEDEEQ